MRAAWDDIDGVDDEDEEVGRMHSWSCQELEYDPARAQGYTFALAVNHTATRTSTRHTIAVVGAGEYVGRRW